MTHAPFSSADPRKQIPIRLLKIRISLLLGICSAGLAGTASFYICQHLSRKTFIEQSITRSTSQIPTPAKTDRVAATASPSLGQFISYLNALNSVSVSDLQTLGQEIRDSPSLTNNTRTILVKQLLSRWARVDFEDAVRFHSTLPLEQRLATNATIVLGAFETKKPSESILSVINQTRLEDRQSIIVLSYEQALRRGYNANDWLEQTRALLSKEEPDRLGPIFSQLQIAANAQTDRLSALSDATTKLSGQDSLRALESIGKILAANTLNENELKATEILSPEQRQALLAGFSEVGGLADVSTVAALLTDDSNVMAPGFLDSFNLCAVDETTCKLACEAMAGDGGYLLATSLYLRHWAKWNPRDAATFLQSMDENRRTKVSKLVLSEEYRQLASNEFLNEVQRLESGK